MPDQRDDVRNTIVPGWTLIRRDQQGESRATCFYRRDDLFCFVVERWFGPWADDDGTFLADAYWSEGRKSGLFASLDDAEKAAKRDLTD